mgnify:CR=1 FL=1
MGVTHSTDIAPLQGADPAKRAISCESYNPANPDSDNLAPLQGADPAKRAILSILCNRVYRVQTPSKKIRGIRVKSAEFV